MGVCPYYSLSIILLRQDRPDKKRQDRGQKIKDFIRKLFKKGGLNYEK